MNKVLKLASLASLVLATQSQAIVGFGAHIAPNSGAEAKGKTGESIGGGTSSDGLFLDRSDVTSLSGFGLKLWIDCIPKIDIEGTANFQFRTYSAQIYSKVGGNEVQGSRVDLSYDPEFPGVSVKAKPALALGTGELSILYPFFKPSFIIGYFQVHAGAGANYTYQSKVLDNATISKALVAASASGQNMDTPEAMGKAIASEVAKESYDQGFGGHIVVGARAKLLMFGLYANEKYYIGGVKDPLKSGFVTELGGGFAF